MRSDQTVDAAHPSELTCEWIARTRKPRTVSKAMGNATPRPARLLEMKQDLRRIDGLSRKGSDSSVAQVSANNQVLDWLNSSRSALTLSNCSFSPSISRSLSTEHIRCANSLLLSPHDRRFLEYFPSCTMVSSYLKPWRWSNLSYIYQYTASSDAIVMRMILAMSGSEMHRLHDETPDSEDVGLYNYNLAVRDLSTALGDKSSDDPKQRLERHLAALLFMVDYEVRFGYSRNNLHLHLEGARSLYASYEKSIMDSERSGTVSTLDDEESGGDSHLSLLSSLLLLLLHPAHAAHPRFTL